MKNILSIQPSVAYGCTGNSAAVFPLQRLGHEVWPVYTANYSMTGKGHRVAASDVREVIAGIEDRGALGEVDVILAGRTDDPELAAVIEEAAARVKELNPAAVFSAQMPLKGADILTVHCDDLDGDDLVAAARELGARVVLVRSNSLEMIALDEHEAWVVRPPHLPVERNGVAELASALFTAHYLEVGDYVDAASMAAWSIFDVLENTYLKDAPELLLVESQEAIANPRLHFEVNPL